MDQFPGTRQGSVNGDDQVVNPLHLFGFRRLNQRHIAVQLQPQGVVTVIKAVRVQLHLFLKDAEPLQKRPVVVPPPVGHRKLLQQIPGLVFGLFLQLLHLALGLLANLPPLLAELFHGGKILVGVRPITVVVHEKLLHQLPVPLFLQPQPRKQPVNALGGEYRQLLAEELIGLLPQPALGAAQAGPS